MLTNMGELVTRELEREWAARQAAASLDSSQSVSLRPSHMRGLKAVFGGLRYQSAMKHSDGTSVCLKYHLARIVLEITCQRLRYDSGIVVVQAVPELIRATECFNEAVMFVDVSQPKWKVLHMNTAAQTRLTLHDIGYSMVEGAEVHLWDLFHTSAAGDILTDPGQQHSEDISKGRKFEVTGVTAHRKSHNSASMPMFDLTFRYVFCKKFKWGNKCLHPIIIASITG